MELKNQLLKCCQDYVDERLVLIKSKIEDLQNSLLAETKSSAGDKHETGRALLQLEREKLGYQLAEVQKLNETLSKIDSLTSSSHISLGSIIFTEKLNYFISISAGEFILEDQKYYALSANTPIGQLLIGKSIGEKIQFRSQSFKIIKVI